MNQEKQYLINLTSTVAKGLTAIDRIMKKPASVDRGRRIAKVCNALDIANDAAMHFCLNYDFEKINKIKKLENDLP